MATLQQVGHACRFVPAIQRPISYRFNVVPLLFIPAQVLAEIRNSFAEKRLNRILAYRKKIRTTTGCNPEDYDAAEGMTPILRCVAVPAIAVIRKFSRRNG